MSLLAYARLARKHWRVALLGFAVVFGLGVLFVATATPQYRATAQVFVAAGSGGDAGQQALGNTFSQARVRSYLSVATSPAVTASVVDELGLAGSADALADRILAVAAPGTVLIDLSVTDPDADEAARVAAAVAERFVTVVEDLERPEASADSPVTLTITQVPVPPAAPSSPNRPLVLAVALVAGTGVGLGGAVLRGLLDTSVKDETLLEALLDAPVLVTVPRGPNGGIAVNDPDDPRAEAFRRLRANLQYVDVDHPPRSIAVTSAIPAEGKSTVALNLAAALAEAGRRVCLVEADLRRPSIARTLGLISDVGLTTVLVGRATLADALQPVDGNLTVLASGVLPPNPAEVLDSEQAAALHDELVAGFDHVILDTAPLLPVTDGAEVAALADATLLVVRHGRSTQSQVSAAVDALAKVDVRAVGGILNGTPRRG